MAAQAPSLPIHRLVVAAAEARLAGPIFGPCHLDVGSGDPALGEPAWVDGDSLLDSAGIPAAHQFADQPHAYTCPWQDRDNSRVKDLMDLDLPVHSGPVEAVQVRRSPQVTFKFGAAHRPTAERPRPPEFWPESFQPLAIESELPVQDMENPRTNTGAFWRVRRLGTVGESRWRHGS